MHVVLRHWPRSALSHSGGNWNTPNLPSYEVLDGPETFIFSFYLAQLVTNWGTEAPELSSLALSSCWWYACEMSNLLKHKSPPLILISRGSGFPRSIVCSGGRKVFLLSILNVLSFHLILSSCSSPSKAISILWGPRHRGLSWDNNLPLSLSPRRPRARWDMERWILAGDFKVR